MAVWTTPNSKELGKAGRWDAEAYTPFLRGLDAKFQKSPRLCDLATVTHAAEITRIYSDASDAKLFLLAQNIRPLLPDTSTEFRISKDSAKAIPTNRLNHGDVLVTPTGAHSGMSAVYLGHDGDCYTSGEGLILRSRGSIDGPYLATFLNTTAGQALCRRAIYGSGQPHIGPKYLEQIRIPRLKDVEENASALVRAAWNEIQSAETLYPAAEAELLDRIGWKDLQNQPQELSYGRDFSDLGAAQRVDAEFFQPQYTRLHARLRELHAVTCKHVIHFVRRGTQPVYDEMGSVLAITEKHLTSTFMNYDGALRVSENFWRSNPSAQVQRGDTLIYSIGAFIGRANVYYGEAKAITTSNTGIIRPTNRINPGYLALFLNSPPGLMQAKQFSCSSGQGALPPEFIKRFLIFLPHRSDGKIDFAWQKRLADKVEAAVNAKAAARAKLEEAKRIVENAI